MKVAVFKKVGEIAAFPRRCGMDPDGRSLAAPIALPHTGSRAQS
jgi:hypothetical protein